LFRLWRRFRLRLLRLGLRLRLWRRLWLRLNLTLWLRRLRLRLKLWRKLAFFSCWTLRAWTFGSATSGINNMILSG
jgi:hypothetical protein